MKSIVLFGAGKIGQMIMALLANDSQYRLTVVDASADNIEKTPCAQNIDKRLIHIDGVGSIESILQGAYAVINAYPFYMAKDIALAAKRSRVHYLDLTEDVRSSLAIFEIAQDADTAFIPQCGLAPGFISIVAHDLAKGFSTLEKVHMRVGALPLYPSNALKYNLTWSTDGLINEYCNPCLAIYDGQLREVLPLEQLEAFSLDGITYEAFNTSGGLGTLCDTLKGKVKNLNYKTVRYPGHCEIVKLLVRDLRLGERRDILKDVLEQAVPATMQDVVLIFVTVSGKKKNRFLQESYAKKIYHKEINGKLWSAIQITTASAVCAVLDLLNQGKIPDRGFVRQEEISLDDFISNRFGGYYA